MPVLLSTYGLRGDVEPMAGHAVRLRLRTLGAETERCDALVTTRVVPAGASR
ncbi:MAG TPA: hypothetical protein VGL97_14470 [Bryobacteraceae bacterium]